MNGMHPIDLVLCAGWNSSENALGFFISEVGGLCVLGGREGYMSLLMYERLRRDLLPSWLGLSARMVKGPSLLIPSLGRKPQYVPMRK